MSDAMTAIEIREGLEFCGILERHRGRPKDPNLVYALCARYRSLVDHVMENAARIMAEDMGASDE